MLAAGYARRCASTPRLASISRASRVCTGRAPRVTPASATLFGQGMTCVVCTSARGWICAPLCVRPPARLHQPRLACLHWQSTSSYTGLINPLWTGNEICGLHKCSRLDMRAAASTPLLASVSRASRVCMADRPYFSDNTLSNTHVVIVEALGGVHPGT